MFRSCYLLLVSMILVTGREVGLGNYDLKIGEDESTLMGVEAIDDLSKELNLSHRWLRRIEDNAFRNVCHIRNLNLSHNFLTSLSEDTFAGLTNLEHLDLSHNIIYIIKRSFIHLSNLKVLDLSKNYLTKLRPNLVFGLNESCAIVLKDNNFYTNIMKNEKTTVIPYGPDTDRYTDKFLFGAATIVKVCINGSKLISVEQYTDGEKLESGCFTDGYYADDTLDLAQLFIAEFEKGWYKLGDSSIHHIDLSKNQISRLTSEIFNDLPESISSISFSYNRIERLEKGIIANKHLRKLIFMVCGIIEIEEDAFINTNLTTLNLRNNLLEDTTFAATLPATLTEINLNRNQIAQISRESFSTLNKLQVLRLQANDITKLQKDLLCGLTGLKELDLMGNKLKIESGSFKGLTNLKLLYLDVENINKLKLGVFAALKSIKEIIIGSDQLWNLGRNSLIHLPDGLEVIHIPNDILDNRKADMFVKFGKNMYLISKTTG